IGSNRAGKSTLLNLVAGTYSPESGTVEINGQDMTTKPVDQRTHLVGRVFKHPVMGIAAVMTFEEDRSLAVRRGRPRGIRLGLNKNRREEFRRLLALLELGLENRLEDPVKLLSGGQRQALTLLMATLGDPEILLLDEYTANLDPK